MKRASIAIALLALGCAQSHRAPGAPITECSVEELFESRIDDAGVAIRLRTEVDCDFDRCEIETTVGPSVLLCVVVLCVDGHPVRSREDCDR